MATARDFDAGAWDQPIKNAGSCNRLPAFFQIINGY